MNNDILIFIVTHTNINRLRLSSAYKYIGVGKDILHINSDFKDFTYDNISNKNENYCELTAQYWIWKNSPVSFVGLCHYRRFFYHPYFSMFNFKIYSGKKLLKILKKYNVIVAEKVNVEKMGYNSVYSQYCGNHYEKDLKALEKIIKDKYSDYYEVYTKVMNDKYFYPFNMIVCEKRIFNDYSEFLFDVLFQLEKNIDIKGYDNYQKRIFGFISERLLMVYLHKHKELKIKELPVGQPNSNNKLIGLKRMIKKIVTLKR